MADVPPTMTDATRQAAAPSRLTATPAAARRRPRVSVRYIVCIALLAVTAAGLPAWTSFMGIYTRKEALPLKLSLARFEREPAERWRHIEAQPGLPLSEDELTQLGTREYLSVTLIDNDPDRPNSPRTRYAHVFVTYYTGKPDAVPHRPDECMVAAGYVLGQASYDAYVPIPGVGAEDDQLPVRVAVFRPTGARTSFDVDEPQTEIPVLYLFVCNDQYRTTRNGVRALLGYLWERFAYYAKIEIRFTDAKGLPANTEESLAAAPRILEPLLKTLRDYHLPDWEQRHELLEPARSSDD